MLHSAVYCVRTTAGVWPAEDYRLQTTGSRLQAPGHYPPPGGLIYTAKPSLISAHIAVSFQDFSSFISFCPLPLSLSPSLFLCRESPPLPPRLPPHVPPELQDICSQRAVRCHSRALQYRGPPPGGSVAAGGSNSTPRTTNPGGGAC